MAKDTGIVNIHGKEYMTVAYRVKQLREQHNLDIGITTDIVSIDDEVVVVKAILTDKSGFVIATGHAEENRKASMINKTSALENCETSAIGRALAGAGYIGTEFASADEVAQAITHQGSGTTVGKGYNTSSTKKLTPKQIQFLGGKIKYANRDAGINVDNEEIGIIFEEIYGKSILEVTMSEMNQALKLVDEYAEDLKTQEKPYKKETDVDVSDLPY